MRKLYCKFWPLRRQRCGSAAWAQTPTAAATVIAIPDDHADSGARGNELLALGWEATQLIAADFSRHRELMPLPPKQ